MTVTSIVVETFKAYGMSFTQFILNVNIHQRNAALSGLVVSVLATGPMGHAVAGSGQAEDVGFLWVIKIRSAHCVRTGNKAVGPML
jgi:hypothetical protein